MTNSPTVVGLKAYYQHRYRHCFIRNQCAGNERCQGHVIRPEAVIGPGRFLGLAVDCDGDLDAAIERAVDYFLVHKPDFEWTTPRLRDWEKEAGDG